MFLTVTWLPYEGNEIDEFDTLEQVKEVIKQKAKSKYFEKDNYFIYEVAREINIKELLKDD